MDNLAISVMKSGEELRSPLYSSSGVDSQNPSSPRDVSRNHVFSLPLVFSLYGITPPQAALCYCTDKVRPGTSTLFLCHSQMIYQAFLCNFEKR